MRRAFFGFIWFIVLYIGGLAVAGGIVGSMAGSHASETSANPPKTFSEGYAVGYEAGHNAGQEFGRKYGLLFLIGSLLIAVAGSATGVLPGTKKTIKKGGTDA